MSSYSIRVWIFTGISPTLILFFFFLMIRHPPRSTLFPSTTLSRSEMAERGIDVKSHRERIVEENLEEKFKDPQDPLRLAFVCSMWTTGFDVPSLSTVYLDKPLRSEEHTSELQSQSNLVCRLLLEKK